MNCSLTRTSALLEPVVLLSVVFDGVGAAGALVSFDLFVAAASLAEAGDGEDTEGTITSVVVADDTVPVLSAMASDDNNDNNNNNNNRNSNNKREPCPSRLLFLWFLDFWVVLMAGSERKIQSVHQPSCTNILPEVAKNPDGKGENRTPESIKPIRRNTFLFVCVVFTFSKTKAGRRIVQGESEGGPPLCNASTKRAFTLDS